MMVFRSCYMLMFVSCSMLVSMGFFAMMVVTEYRLVFKLSMHPGGEGFIKVYYIHC